MASLTQRTWVWVNSRNWWWTGRPGVLRFMGLQRIRHDWATELNWTPSVYFCLCLPVCDPMDYSMPSLSFTVSQSLLKLMSIESVMPSNHRPLLFLPSIFPSIRVFPVSQLFALGGRSIGTSASSSVLPVNIQGWFPLQMTGLISLLSKGLPRVFSSIAVWRHQFFSVQPFWWSSSHIHTWLLKKLHTRASIIQTFVGKVMSLLFNMLSRLVIAFLPRSKHLLISWLQSPSTVILETKEINSVPLLGEGNGNPLQYPCLESPMDGGACWAAVLGVTQSQAWLSN